MEDGGNKQQSDSRPSNTNSQMKKIQVVVSRYGYSFALRRLEDDKQHWPRSQETSDGVNVYFQGQESMKITAQQEDRIWKITEEIIAKTKVSLEKKMLCLLYRVLNPETKVSDNCLDPSSIHLKKKFVYPSDEEVLVVFYEVDIGETHILPVRPSTSVSQFIELIKSKAIVPPKGRVMYFNDKALQHGKVMSDYLRPECNVLYSYNGWIGGYPEI
ncbi:ubiquitin D-like isoform X2 [Notamacropus eugenii]|uniref:ubiquitin D-like isoform X2 n=1 Tax=Notamacropus eugenii TaxID=9315 RepID=UPI003B67D73E